MKKILIPLFVFLIGVAIIICGIHFKWFCVQTLNAAGMPIVTLFALSITWFEYLNHKNTQKNIIFNKLNDIYYQNHAVRRVAVYLSNDERNAREPTAFETEAFLRFFEEVQVCIEDGQIGKERAYDLFSYYCMDIMDKKGKHHSLLDKIDYKEEDWHLLNKFYNNMIIIRNERSRNVAS